MDETSVREQAQAFLDALAAGDVEHAIEHLSPELRRNLGEVLSLFPLPVVDAEVESFERTPTGWKTVLRLAGANDEVQVETRWKDRDGSPTIVEASHLSRVARVAEAEPEGGEIEPQEPQPAA